MSAGLSEAYDGFPHHLLIAKMEGYGVSKKHLLFPYSYLTSQRKHTKVGSSYIVPDIIDV